MRNVIETLDRIGQLANEYHEYLNAGGCCVYASKIVSLLRRRKIEAWGVFAGEDWNVDSATENAPSHANPVHHVLVGFVLNGTEYIHDSNGTHPMPDIGEPDPSLGYPIANGRVHSTRLAQYAKMRRVWNSFGWGQSFEAVDSAIKAVLSSRRKVKV